MTPTATAAATAADRAIKASKDEYRAAIGPDLAGGLDETGEFERAWRICIDTAVPDPPTILTAADADRRVSVGADLLDDHFGPDVDWRSTINVDTLDIGTDRQCILGQLFGHYDLGVAALTLGYRGVEDGGFCPGHYMGDDDLTDAWTRNLLPPPDMHDQAELDSQS